MLEKLQHWRLLHVSQGFETTASHDTKILRKISKPKCDFEATAAAQNKTMKNEQNNEILRLLRTTITKIAKTFVTRIIYSFTSQENCPRKTQPGKAVLDCIESRTSLVGKYIIKRFFKITRGGQPLTALKNTSSN